MFASLPLFAIALLYGIFRQRNACWRSAILSAAVVWGLSITAITEILSLGNSLTFSWLVGLWGLGDIVLIYINLQLLIKREGIVHQETHVKLSPFLTLLLCGTASVVAAVGLVALIAPPNTWDSMSYHMARVVHWIQNRSVDHYPTNYTPQLFIGPWAGFAITNLQILAGGDRLANLVQWASMVGSIVGVSLIAKYIGADVRGQIFSAVVCATIPMGVLQGSSTQNDYVVAFWLVCLATYVLSAINQSVSNSNVFLIGGSLGLAVLSKQTAYIFAFPVLVCFFILIIRKAGWKTWKIAVAIGFLILLINSGHFARNFDLFHSPLGDPSWPYTNEVFSLPTFISNIVRNISLHLGLPPFSSLPQIFSYSAREAIDLAIRAIHAYINVDISDPRTTWTKFALADFALHEDFAANLAHAILLLSTITFCLAWERLRRQRYLVIYLMLGVSAFLLFSFLLKWTPWHSRLHLPLFVLASPFIGTVLSNIPSIRLANSIVLILLPLATPFCFFSYTRPLISQDMRFKGRLENVFNTTRTYQYFINRPYLREPYIGAASFLRSRGCPDVGLLLGGGGDWEYPFWVLLKQHGEARDIRIEQINISNVSAVKTAEYPYANFVPCGIIVVEPENVQEVPSKEIVTRKGTYVRAWSAPPVSVFMASRNFP